MLQRNLTTTPVTLPEYREQSGAIHPTVSVEPDAEIDWPVRIAGFEALEANAAETASPSAPAETAPVAVPEPLSAPADAVAKPASKAAAKTVAKGEVQ